MKKKQPDFQKTKLRVGKSTKLLPKGKNVTNTAFKSKKIITKDQKFKANPDDIALEDILILATHHNVPLKSGAIEKIIKHVEKNSDSLKSYFFDILKVVGKLLLDSNKNVRKLTVELVDRCLDFLTATQIDCFMETLTSQLSCMMTHINISVRKDSLNLLSILLKSAPSSVCYSKKVLPNLLDMISSRKPQKKTSSPKRRKLEDNISSDMTSVDWRDQVMTLILELLQSLVDAHKEQTSQDEQKVYLDRKHLVNVPLYAGGGLTPAKVEFPSSLLIKSKIQIAEQLRIFLGDLVKVSSDIITEEMAGHKKILPSKTIEHLNTITQVLCCLGQWYKMQGSQLDEDFLTIMHEMINKKLMIAFPYSIHESVSKKSCEKPNENTCLHLNLGIIYLFSTFILGTEYSQPAKERKIIICLLDAMGYGFTLDEKSVLLILDSLKVFIQDISFCDGEEKNKYKQEISAILDALNDFLINSKDNNLKKEVQQLFIDIALNYDYQMFLEYKGMKNWIEFTFGQIKLMAYKKRTDEVTLKCINQMCSREYPAVMSILSEIDPLELLEYLKFENEDFQFTIMNLITHMTQLPPDFLQEVTYLILSDQSLSVQTVTKCIRLLFVRFSDERVSENEVREYVKFLLNISLDIVSIERIMNEIQALNQINIQDPRSIQEEDMMSENSQQYDTGEVIHQQNYTCQKNNLKRLLLDVQSRCMYRILPSMMWKRQLDIFKVCLECLLAYKNREIVANSTTAFLSELLRNKVTLPVHSAIALMEIATKIYIYNEYEFRSDCAKMILDELTVASLFYISVLTHKVPENAKLKEFCISGLQDSLYLSKKRTSCILELLVNKVYEQGMDEVICLYILRILKFFIARQYTNAELIMKSSILNFIQLAEGYCPENTLEHAYLIEIYDYLHSHQA